MNYLLLFTNILLFTVQTLCFKEFNRSYMKNLSNYFFFNFLYYSVIVLVFLTAMESMKPFHIYTIVIGGCFGILYVVTILCYMKAMELGPLSYTSLFFSFGIVVPVAYGLFFWNETISVIQIAGLLLLLATFYIGNQTTEGEKRQFNLRWLGFSVAAFLGNGILATLSKTHQLLMSGEQMNEYLIVSFGIAAILSLLVVLLYSRVSPSETKHLKSVPFIWLVIGTGISTAFGNLLALYLNTRIASIVQFPTVSGGIVLFSTLLSTVIFKEKLNSKGAAGLGLGMVALVLLSIK